MNIFENNLKLLSKNNPALAERLAKHENITSEFSLEESRSGDPNMKKNGYFLHDIFDPEQEAIDLLNKIEHKHSNAFNFIYGLGLGYVLKRFNKKLEGYIIVYEPDIDVLRLTLEMVDFSDELSNPKVFIFDKLDDVETIYPKYYFANYAVSTSIRETYKQNELNTAQEFVNKLGYIHGIYESNYRTYWQKTPKWVASLVSNISNISKYDEVMILKDKFKNKPALVISAGPSLNKNIQEIAKYQDNFVIICVGTALKSVLKYGIKPDCICFVEYHPVTAKMISEGEGKNSNIILQPITYSALYDAPAKNKFIFYADNDEVSKWAAKKFNINQKEYINRGTVSVNALVSAKIMGCNPIVLVGQDLAYTDSKCYADGSIYEDLKVENGVVSTDLTKTLSKTDVSEKVLTNRLNSLTKQLYKVKGQNGEMLTAPGDYASFIKYFEEIAVDYNAQSIKLINATQGGAQLNGYENMMFLDVVDKFANITLDKSINYQQPTTTLKQDIIKKEIAKTLQLFEASYKQFFEQGNEIANRMAEYNKNIQNAYVIYEKELIELLKLYKSIRLLPKSDLLELLMVRNIFFTEHYILNANDWKNKNNLLFYLHWLFKYDYEKFVLEQIKILKTIEIA